MIFRDFVEQQRDAVESVAFSVQGERDVAPMLHLESENGITVVGIDRDFFANATSVELLVRRFVLPLLDQHQARKVGWTYCAWIAPEDCTRPSEHPDRREMLLATFIDSEVVEHWAAPIIRPDGRLLIGAWESAIPNLGGGPLISTIQEKLR